jgi:hypothetical protein
LPDAFGHAERKMLDTMRDWYSAHCDDFQKYATNSGVLNAAHADSDVSLPTDDPVLEDILMKKYKREPWMNAVSIVVASAITVVSSGGGTNHKDEGEYHIGVGDRRAQRRCELVRGVGKGVNNDSRRAPLNNINAGYHHHQNRQKTNGQQRQQCGNTNRSLKHSNRRNK